MALHPPYLVASILSASSAVWWIVAPAIVGTSDPRLRTRNPDHHAKLVRFYRAWGCSAILVGAVVTLAV